MNERTRLKTRSRLSDFYKTNHSIKTDKGQLLFRIDSPGSVPQDPESARSEPETFEWIRKYLRANEVLWDIGANIGEWTLRMANKVGINGRVYSFEPIPVINQSLNKTLRVNNLSQVILSQIALDSLSGQSNFTIPIDESDRAIHGESRLGTEEENWNIFTNVKKTKTNRSEDDEA